MHRYNHKTLLVICAWGVIHCIQVIRLVGGLFVYMLFTSSSLMVSNFAVCGTPFLDGLYSKDFILEMFSLRYVNMFGFFLPFNLTLRGYPYLIQEKNDWL